MVRSLTNYYTPFTYTNYTSEQNDIINVSSLPSPSSASLNYLYNLSKDDKLYYVNQAQTLWLPVESPGWPRANGTDDDDFEGTNADPPTGWTWENQDSIVVDCNNALKSHLVLSKSVAGSNVSSLYKTVSGLDTGTRFSLKVNLNTQTAEDVYECRCFIGLRESSTGKLVVMWMENSTATPYPPTFKTDKWTNYSTFFSNGIIGGYEWIPHAYPIILSVRYTGGNFEFSWACYYGGTSLVYSLFHSYANSSFMTTVDQACFGIFLSSATSSKKTTTFFDWARFT